MDESFFCDELLHRFEQVDSDYKYAPNYNMKDQASPDNGHSMDVDSPSGAVCEMDEESSDSDDSEAVYALAPKQR